MLRRRAPHRTGRTAGGHCTAISLQHFCHVVVVVQRWPIRRGVCHASERIAASADRGAPRRHSHFGRRQRQLCSVLFARPRAAATYGRRAVVLAARAAQRRVSQPTRRARAALVRWRWRFAAQRESDRPARQLAAAFGVRARAARVRRLAAAVRRAAGARQWRRVEPDRRSNVVWRPAHIGACVV